MPQPRGAPDPLVIGLPRGHELRPRRGECLLDAARRADVPLASSCGGQGICGDCVVRVVAGAVNLAPPDDVERAWFARAPRPGSVGPGSVGPGSVRLACRLRVHGPATVATTYW